MGKTKDKKSKSNGSTSSEKAATKVGSVPSDQKKTVQIVLDYISSLGYKKASEELEKATGLKAVRIQLEF